MFLIVKEKCQVRLSFLDKVFNVKVIMYVKFYPSLVLLMILDNIKVVKVVKVVKGFKVVKDVKVVRLTKVINVIELV